MYDDVWRCMTMYDDDDNVISNSYWRSPCAPSMDMAKLACCNPKSPLLWDEMRLVAGSALFLRVKAVLATRARVATWFWISNVLWSSIAMYGNGDVWHCHDVWRCMTMYDDCYRQVATQPSNITMYGDVWKIQRTYIAIHRAVQRGGGMRSELLSKLRLWNMNTFFIHRHTSPYITDVFIHRHTSPRSQHTSHSIFDRTRHARFSIGR